jgi:hypothetical protein
VQDALQPAALHEYGVQFVVEGEVQAPAPLQTLSGVKLGVVQLASVH